jgi:Calcineurin-like phosphoesterase
MSEQHYDIIGDVHGHADALRRLLIKLGYAEVQGAFRHDSRKVIFVGDFVYRGPDQRDVLKIARDMCEADTASAVLGNHEFNAIAWATPDGQGGFLRKHSEKNMTQHSAFLGQLGEGSTEYWDAINWFRQLPVWLEFPGLRVVHACWHEPSQAALGPYLDASQCFTDDGFREALRRGSEPFAAAEILLKGPEQRLPPGMTFTDQSGDVRREVRVRWWDPDATTFKQAAIGIDDRLDELPDCELPTDFRYLENTPVLFGHYWIPGKPKITFPTAACLDFSVARNGYLTAYRWSGERELSNEHLVYVAAENEGGGTGAA